MAGALLTLRASHAGIPALHKLSCGIAHQYTSGTLCQRQASHAGIPALFSKAYWHQNAQVIEIQTRQQLKYKLFHETQRIFVNKFCIWTPATTAGDETAATGGVMYTNEGKLEFEEDEMAALEGQRLVAELFPDSGSESDFEGFHVSQPTGNLSGGDDSGSKAVTESNDDDEGVTCRLSDAAAAAAYRMDHNLPD